MKRILIGILALMLMLSGMVSAIGEELGTPDPSLITRAGPLPQDAYNGYMPLSEHITLTIGGGLSERAVFHNGETYDDNYAIAFYEKAMNVDIVTDWAVMIGDAYTQKVSLQIATGDLPDVMIVNEAQLRQLVKVDMLEDLTAAYEQHASELLRACYGTTNGISLGGATFKDKLYALPRVLPGADGINMLYIRADWMDELGLSAPKTLDDVIHIVKEFQEKKGISAGIVCSNSLIKMDNNAYGMDALFALYNAYPEMWINDDDGNLMYGSIAPETKTALGEIAKLVASGVIDKNFAVKDSTQCEEIVTSSQGGVFFGPWWTLQWPLLNMNKSDPVPRWNVYTAPLDENGYFNTHMINPSNRYMVLVKGHENPEAAAEAIVKYANIARYWDWANGLPVPEGYDASEEQPWNPVGFQPTPYDDKEQFAINVQAVIDGKLTYDELSPFHKVLHDTYLDVEERGVHTVIQEKSANEWAWVVGTMALVENEDHVNRVFAATYSRSPIMEKKWAALEKLEDETFMQIILGEKPLDTFDTFVNDWKSLGGDEVTAELAAMMAE